MLFANVDNNAQEFIYATCDKNFLNCKKSVTSKLQKNLPFRFFHNIKKFSKLADILFVKTCCTCLGNHECDFTGHDTF